MAVNGVKGAGAKDICHRGPCMCGFQLSDVELARKDGTVHRQHAFWGCPVAQAVLGQLERVLGERSVTQEHVWLLRPPRGDVALPVWRVVCLASLQAMETGRKFLWWRRHQPDGYDELALQEAQARAVSAFWLALHDFVRYNRRVPKKGWAAVGNNHPFLAVRVQVPLRVPRVRVVIP